MLATPNLPVRQVIEDIQAWVGSLPQAELGLHHLFAKGLYARQLIIPKGCLLVGRIHKFEHMNFVLKGDISVLTEEGTVRRIVAPQVMVSPPGTKRVGYAREETVWVTVHATDCTDPDKVEEVLTLSDYNQSEDVQKLVAGLEALQ